MYPIDSVDKIIQGNTGNIVFLKSTDDTMIDTLVKMTGIKHETRRDQKTITRDNERMFNKNEGKISYTMTTKEVPVISFNDFMFIAPQNSIILKATESPIWNHNETVYPMSWRLFQNTIKLPGKKFSLQTIPTNSTAKDFDVRKNQPDFFAMLEQRIKQAKMSDETKKSYLDRYGLSEGDLIRLDQNVVADDIMLAINTRLFNMTRAEEAQNADHEDEPVMDDLDIMASATDNTELEQEAAKAQAEQSVHAEKRYANHQISRDDLASMGGAVNRQLEDVLTAAYAECRQFFDDTPGFRVTPDGDLISETGELYIRSSRGANRADVASLDDAGKDQAARVFNENDAPDAGQPFYEVTDAFIKYLVTLDSWSGLAGGRFESEAGRAYQSKMTV